MGSARAGVAEEVEGERDYHFGLQAVGLGELSLYWAKRVRLRGAARVYLVGEKLSPDPDSYEDIQYGIAELVYRIAGPHALGVEYTGARRKARYPDVPDVHMNANQVSRELPVRVRPRARRRLLTAAAGFDPEGGGTNVRAP